MSLSRSLQIAAGSTNANSSPFLLASAVGANPALNISARPIPQEPMVSILRCVRRLVLNAIRTQYLLANLAISPTFGGAFLRFSLQWSSGLKISDDTIVQSAFLTFPAVMHIDYIRVYQVRFRSSQKIEESDHFSTYRIPRRRTLGVARRTSPLRIISTRASMHIIFVP